MRFMSWILKSYLAVRTYMKGDKYGFKIATCRAFHRSQQAILLTLFMLYFLFSVFIFLVSNGISNFPVFCDNNVRNSQQKISFYLPKYAEAFLVAGRELRRGLCWPNKSRYSVLYVFFPTRPNKGRKCSKPLANLYVHWLRVIILLSPKYHDVYSQSFT